MAARRLVPVVLALSWACAEEAAAKCGFHTYVVVGRVVDLPVLEVWRAADPTENGGR